MGGSGGYGRSRGWQPADLESSLERTRQQAAEAEVAAAFADALAEINQTDTEALNRHKDEILSALQSTFEEAYDLRGGGSYTRHTYVNGLSDVDILFVLGQFSESKIPNKEDPKAVLADMRKRLRQRFPDTKITSGRMAITIKLTDGLELQVLRAFRYRSGYRIPDPQGSGWTTTGPQVFAKLLQQRNSEVGGKLLRCMKLAKRICANRDIEVKSYHMENMAVKAFEHYAGARSDEDMLRHLFNQAKVQAASRMKDITGQEEYVDRYLTSKTQRTTLAKQLAAIEREIVRAEGNGQAWRNLLNLP